MCFRFVVVQSAGQESSQEDENSQDRWRGTEGHDSSYSDSDEEEETKGIVTGIIIIVTIMIVIFCGGGFQRLIFFNQVNVFKKSLPCSSSSHYFQITKIQSNVRKWTRPVGGCLS